MNEVKNMFNVENDVYAYLCNYIKENANITTKVAKFVHKTANPLIVFEENRNELLSRSTTYDNTKRTLSYRIDIYCKKLPTCREIVKELIVLVCEVFEGKYHMQGGLIGQTPNYDSANEESYSATLRFSTRFIPSINKIY